MKKLLPLIIVLLFICGEARSSSSESLRCGKPSFREKTSSRRGGIEKWYYDKGSGDFIYFLIFHGGILKYVEQSGRCK